MKVVLSIVLFLSFLKVNGQDAEIFKPDSIGKKSIRATDFKRDFNYRQHDMVTLSFDAFNDNRNAIALATNPYGVQRDLLSFDDLYYDTDWDGLWRVRTSRTDSGWVAEI